jgi:phosphonate transport system substrate-binding protein
MKFTKVLVLLLVLGLIAAACAGEDTADTTTTTATTDTTAATTTTAGETTTTEEDPMADWPDKIVFGFVPSQEQEQLQDDIQPFIDVIQGALGIEVEGVVTTDYTGLVTALGTGQADFGAFGPFGYVLAEQQFPNIEVLIQSIRRGAATYHGQWFTNDPSLCDNDPAPGAFENEPIGDPNAEPVLKAPTDVLAQQVGYDYPSGGEPTRTEGVSEGYACEGVEFADLARKTIAWTTETSTSGYVFPALQLINAGLDIDTDITSVFTGGHDGAVIAVYNGDADVGVSFDDARGIIEETNPDVGEKVIVFNLTSEIPNDVVAVNGELPDSLKQAVYDAIAAYLETDEGKAVFDTIYEWTAIRPANDADFDVVRDAAVKLGITEP